MKSFSGKWACGVLVLSLGIPLGLQAAPQMEADPEAKPKPEASQKLHQTDPALWQIQNRSQVERRERFLREIRKLYQNEEGPGI